MAKRSRALLAVAVLAPAWGCSRPAAEQPTKREPPAVEDVAPPVDADLTLADDVKGPPIVEGLGGVLPSSYPTGLPVPVPSSIVDFETSDGSGFVEFESPSPLASLAPSLRRKVAAAGWRVTGGEHDWRATANGRQVRLLLRASGGGTRVRVEY